MNFPEPVIAVAIEPKTKADQEKMGMALGKLMQEDPTFQRPHGQGDRADDHLAAWASCISRSSPTAWCASSTSAPTSASRRSPTARRSPRRPSGDGRFVRQSGGRGQYGHCKIRMRPDRRGLTSSSTTRSSAARSPRSSSSRSSRGSRRRSRPGRWPGYPMHGGRGGPLRGHLPRRRLVRDGVQDRRLDGLPGRLQAGAAGPDGADHGGRGGHARGLHGRRHRRHHLAARPDPEHGGRAATSR